MYCGGNFCKVDRIECVSLIENTSLRMLKATAKKESKQISIDILACV